MILTLGKDIAARVRAGHPWIYRDALAAGPRPGRGELVEIRGRDGVTVARGFFDPDGPIAVRVLAHEPARAFAAAFALRQLARARLDSDGIRLIHGEGDHLPGLVLDWYAGVGVLRFDGAAAQAMWEPLVPAILEASAGAGFPIHALHARGVGRGAPGRWLLGEAEATVIHEGTARYEVDVARGQKTGFFLDQRDNRRLVAAHAAGATVLNLFAYTGGFSVAAGLGGARAVTSVDQAAPAIAAARRNLERNGLDGQELIVDDCRDFLANARAAGRRWDIVVCDPPSFAPSAKALPGALAAYRDLNRAAAEVVAEGGLLATASCSSHVTPAAFLDVIAEAVAFRPGARVLDARGAGLDHPVVPAFPEGRYLKLLLLAL